MNGLQLVLGAGLAAGGAVTFLVHLAHARDIYRTKGDDDGHRTH